MPMNDTGGRARYLRAAITSRERESGQSAFGCDDGRREVDGLSLAEVTARSAQQGRSIQRWPDHHSLARSTHTHTYIHTYTYDPCLGKSGLRVVVAGRAGQALGVPGSDWGSGAGVRGRTFFFCLLSGSGSGGRAGTGRCDLKYIDTMVLWYYIVGGTVLYSSRQWFLFWGLSESLRFRHLSMPRWGQQGKARQGKASRRTSQVRGDVVGAPGRDLLGGDLCLVYLAGICDYIVHCMRSGLVLPTRRRLHEPKHASGRDNVC